VQLIWLWKGIERGSRELKGALGLGKQIGEWVRSSNAKLVLFNLILLDIVVME
jgi:hypothetical protein